MRNHDYDAAAEWAEHDMTLPADSATALRGQKAADFGRELVERARGGRPSLDPDAAPGQKSPTRQTRLPRPLDDDLVAYVERTNSSISEVLRDAVREYLDTHRLAS